MKIQPLLLIVFFFNLFGIANAQIGIGTSTPNPSAILDLTSTTKGLMLPRMTASQQLALVHPAIGLTIFNTTSGQIETNVGTVLGGVLWNGPNNGITATAGTNSTQLATTQFVMSNTNRYKSVSSSSEAVTVSPTDVAIPNMILSPPAGTYMVSFNSEYTNVPTTIPSVTTTTYSFYSSTQGILDLNAAYAQIMAIPVTNSIHTITYGSGETLPPGVYSAVGALSIAGVLTLDGGGDSNSVFIFRSSAAVNTGAGTSLVLKNGASACNIFWIAEGAIGLGAGTTMKGTLISHGGAVAMGAESNLVGHMFSTGGAIAFGPGTAVIPVNCSYIDLGILKSFIIYTSAGALGGTAISHITGNLGTDNGLITGFETSIIDGTIFPPGNGTIATTIVTPTIVSPSSTATFSLYQNGIVLADSVRTKINSNYTNEISFQAIATVTENQPIEVRWNVTTGTLKLSNRILTLINVR